MNPTTPKDLLQQWLIGVKSRLLSHYECAKRFDAGAARLGIPTVICSAVVSVISQANASDYPHAQLLTTCVSLLVTVLSGLAAFLHYAEQSAKHREIAVKFSIMRRDIESTLVTTEVTSEVLDGFKKQWNDLDLASPSIPEWVYKKHHLSVSSATVADAVIHDPDAGDDFEDTVPKAVEPIK